jgi:hypothetical protein
MPCAHRTATRVTLLLAFALIAAGPTSCGQGGDQPEDMRPPSAAFEAQNHDFGHVEQGTVVRHAFRFRNSGDAALSVVGLRNACDCTATVAAAETIPAGAGGAIDVACDTAALHGAQERTVTVYTNDPKQRVTLLTLRGEVDLDVAVDPSSIYVGSLPRGAIIDEDVAVLSPRHGTRKVTSIESSGKVLNVVPAEEGQLALAIAMDAPLGSFAEDVLLYTVSHRRPLLRLHVRGTVQADVVATPAELSFDGDARAGAVRRLLITNLRPDRPVRVTGAEIDEGLGRASAEVVTEGLRYRVELRLNDPLPAGAHEGTLVVRTDHPEQPRISVPVRLGAEPRRHRSSAGGPNG